VGANRSFAPESPVQSRCVRSDIQRLQILKTGQAATEHRDHFPLSLSSPLYEPLRDIPVPLQRRFARSNFLWYCLR
jgi:hypothetical protein